MTFTLIRRSGGSQALHTLAVAAVVAVAASLPLSAGGCAGERSRRDGAGPSVVRLTGRVAVKGSEPHTYLALVTADGIEYEMVGPLREELWRLQSRTVTVEGTLARPAVGPGFPAQVEVQRAIAE